MIIEDRQIYATATFSAVLVVDAQAFAHTAQTTVFAVKNGFVSIGEEMAYVAVVLRQFFATGFVAAMLCTRLDSETMHAHHFFDCIPIDLVVLIGIVTKTTRVEATTTRSTNFGLSRIMGTAENALCLVMV
jgi:hypothetical protein